MAEFLCQSPRVLADPLQVNSFACSLVHWLATATREVGGEGGVLLLPMAEWVSVVECSGAVCLRPLALSLLCHVCTAGQVVVATRMQLFCHSAIRTHCSAQGSTMFHPYSLYFLIHI